MDTAHWEVYFTVWFLSKNRCLILMETIQVIWCNCMVGVYNSPPRVYHGGSAQIMVTLMVLLVM